MKKARKLFSCLLAIILMGSMIGPMLKSSIVQAEEDVIEVRTIEDLYAINLDLDGHYKLMNDIDMTEATAEGGAWNPNGNGWEAISGTFSGEFDGDGHKIIGMKATESSLFDVVSGTVKNLTFEECEIRTGTGVICREIKETGVVDHCITNGTIVGSCGAICSVNRGRISSSINYCNVIGGHNARCAGICKENYGTIIDCANHGNISAASNYYNGWAGGLCCFLYGSIVNSFNSGSITAYAGQEYITGMNPAAGGLACSTFNSSYNASIVNSYNCGKVNSHYRYPYTCSKYNLAPNKYVSINNSYWIADDYGYIYSENSGQYTVEQMKLKMFYEGFDFDNTWFIDNATTYPYPQLRSNPQDTNKLIDEIAISNYPKKISYYTGETIDVTGGVLCVYYVDGTYAWIPMTESMVSSEPLTETGPQEVTVTYRDAQCTYDINVSEMPGVVSVELASGPYRTEFVKGTSFDFYGAVAHVVYDNDTTRDIEITADMTTGGDINRLGEQTIQYTYMDHTIEFNVTVVGLRIEEIEITSLPDKLQYIEGQELDLTGLEVMGYFNSGEVRAIEDYTVSGYTGQPGTQTITVTYLDLSATFDVTVREKTVESLGITAAPLKTEYIQGEAFDPKGMVVRATYDNGDVETVTDYTIGEMPTETGHQRIQISYGGAKTYVVVNILEKELIGIEIDTPPNKTIYVEEEPFSAAGLVICAVYNDDSHMEVTDYTLSSADTSTIGTREITVYYKGTTATFEYTVVEKTLEYLDVTLPDKTVYLAGEEFDPTGMKVFACYNNGKRYEVEDYEVTGFTGDTGTNTIVVSYQGKEYRFPVTIYEPAAEWTVVAEPTCTEPGRKVLYSSDGTYVIREEEIPALGHTAKTDKGTSPTCTEDGLSDGSHCEVCGVVLQEQTVIPAKGHTPSAEWSVVTTPTCTQGGSKVKYCVDCGEVVETAEESATGHKPVVDEAVPATCTTSGLTEGTHCSVCGLTLTAPEVIDPLGHQWSKGMVVVAPTCTKPGVKEITCLRCEETKTEVILALDHEFSDEWTVDTEPTCTTKGSKSHHCIRCDEKSDETVIPATGHSFTKYTSNNDATCTEDGTKTAKCDHCDVTNTIPDVGTAGHKPIADPSVAPTCTQNGLTEGSHCSVCGEVLTAQEQIPALGHRFGDWTTTKPAKCTETGQKERVCSVCGEKETETTPVLGHKWNNDYTEDSPATCSHTGSKSIHCSVCNAIQEGTEQVIPKIPHEWDDGVITKQPTCTSKGTKTFTCLICDETKVELVPALGHKWNNNYTEDETPTCTHEGSKSIHCSVCDAIQEGTEQVIPKTEHKWDNGVVTKQPTTTAEGEKTFTCTVCKETKTESIPKLKNSVTIYRLYNPKTKEHLWTANAKEYDVLPGYGWKQEGIAWKAPASGTAVYRLYNPNTKDHHYTASANEAKVLTAQHGWKYDNNQKPVFYSGGKTPVYRLYNKSFKVGSHHLTKSKKEYDTLPSYGWKQEGIALYCE